MTTLNPLTRPPRHLGPRLESGVGDLPVASYLHQQVALNDPFSKFGPKVYGKFTDCDDPIGETHWEELDDGSSGTDLNSDQAGGVWQLVTAAADNDYKARASFSEVFKFAADKPLWAEARVKHTQGDTSLDAALWFGLTDTLTTGGLQASAAGPLASYDGALWWKDEDGSVLNFECSNAGTQDTKSSVVAWPDATWVRLAFYFDGVGSITPYYNVAGGFDLTAAEPAVTLSLTGLEEMHLVVGVKAGPGGGAETLELDWLGCWQVR